MSRPKVSADATLYESKWWNRLAAISEQGTNDQAVARFESERERPGFFSTLSSLVDSLLEKRLTTSIVKMN